MCYYKSMNKEFKPNVGNLKSVIGKLRQIYDINLREQRDDVIDLLVDSSFGG